MAGKRMRQPSGCPDCQPSVLSYFLGMLSVVISCEALPCCDEEPSFRATNSSPLHRPVLAVDGFGISWVLGADTLSYFLVH